LRAVGWWLGGVRRWVMSEVGGGWGACSCVKCMQAWGQEWGHSCTSHTLLLYTHLQVPLWVPVAVIEDDSVGCLQVQAKTSTARGRQEDGDLTQQQPHQQAHSVSRWLCSSSGTRSSRHAQLLMQATHNAVKAGSLLNARTALLWSHQLLHIVHYCCGTLPSCSPCAGPSRASHDASTDCCALHPCHSAPCCS